MSKRNKLERRVKNFFIQPSYDSSGRYFSYCNFKYHKGILTEKQADECIAKKCWYYKIFREEK